MEKLTQDDATSHNIVADNIDKLKAIFPEAFTEGKVDFDKLKETLGEYRETRDERYNFSWAGKSKARRLAQAPTTGTLRPCPKESVDWDNTENLFIEGDNLEVLKLLQKSYQGQVKMIYIDPPYNTGGDFVYPDKYADNLKGYLEYSNQVDEDGNKQSSNTEASGRFHSNWLNMMLPRINLAKNLLTKDGLIFISIDDHEVKSLRSMCDEIFGEENFVNILVWKKRYNAAKEKQLATIHEYVLIYSKNKDEIEEFFVPGTKEYFDSIYKEKDEYFETRGRFMTQPLEAGNSMDSRPNLRFAIPAPDGSEIWPRRQWVWGQEKVNHALANGLLKIYQNKDGEWKVRHKRYELDEDGNPREMKPFSIYDKCYTQDGTSELTELFGRNDVFPFPKPSQYIKHLLHFGCDKNSTILDFFSGSCSTAHAVYDLNKDDNGKRKFIMVQLPELCASDTGACKSGYRTIAEIGKDRCRLVAEAIKKDLPEYKGDLGFKVFKLDSSNIEAWDSNIENLEDNVLKAANVLKDDRSELDIVYELFLKYGLDLSYPVNTHEVAGKLVYEIGVGSLFICLEDGITTDFVEALAKLCQKFRDEDDEKKNSTRVVFKDSGFKTDAAKKDAESTLKDAGILDVKCL